MSRAEAGYLCEECATVSILVIFILSLWIPSPCRAAAPGRPEGAASLPSPATHGWWEQVRHSIQLEEYGAVVSDDAASEYRAANPAQGFDTRFHARGLTVKGRDAAGWQWGLSLSAWGRPTLREPSTGVVSPRARIGSIWTGAC